jgi:hypothetical protein
MANNNRRRHRPPRPEGAPEPRDYQAPKSPAQAEAEGVETVTVRWRGFNLIIPARPELWSYWNVMRHLHTDMPTGVCNLIGQRQTSQIFARHPQLTAGEAAELFADLFNEIAKAVGFGSSGNS